MKKPIIAAFLAFAIGAMTPAFATNIYNTPILKAPIRGSELIEKLRDNGSPVALEQVARKRCRTVCYRTSTTAGTTPSYCIRQCS